jgi:hypothetical protein
VNLEVLYSESRQSRYKFERTLGCVVDCRPSGEVFVRGVWIASTG